jgi:uncharacterized membrane protein required for colicin V production
MWLDILFLIVLAYGFWQGWSQGIVETLLTICIYLFGIVAAYKMAPVTLPLVENIARSNHPILFVVAFGANFLLLYILIRFATESIENVLHGAYLGTFNRLFGGVLVGGFYVLLLSVLVWFLTQANGLSEETKRISQSYKIMKDMPGVAKNLAVRLQPHASDSWTRFMGWMDDVQDFGVKQTEGKARVYDLPFKSTEETPFEGEVKETKKTSRTQDSKPIEND